MSSSGLRSLILWGGVVIGVVLAAPVPGNAFAVHGPVGLGTNAYLKQEVSPPPSVSEQKRAAAAAAQAEYERAMNKYREEMIRYEQERIRIENLKRSAKNKKKRSESSKESKKAKGNGGKDKELQLQATPTSVCESGTLFLCINQEREESINEDGKKVLTLRTELVPLCSEPAKGANCTRVY
ncbi:MAG: hypothetical protein CUN56_00650 [Phototrophicales bacterium]|nr:MAG: hypothetical protein CUN56_00650 [Phototrophicales bacterium]